MSAEQQIEETPTLWEAAGMTPIRKRASGRIVEPMKEALRIDVREHKSAGERILRELRETGPGFAEDIGLDLHIKRCTVNRALLKLKERGLVTKSDPVPRANRMAPLWRAV